MHITNLIGPRIRQLNTLLRRQVEASEEALPRAQQFTLGYLARHQDRVLYPKDLEDAFSLTHPTVSGILRRLEERGYVRLIPEERDRRRRRICLTDKALEREAVVQEAIVRTEPQVFRGFTQQERDVFFRLLSRAIENMGGTPCNLIPKEEPIEHDETVGPVHPGI